MARKRVFASTARSSSLFRICLAMQASGDVQPSLLLLVRRGSEGCRGVGRTPHVGTAHLGDSLVAEGGVVDPDSRNRSEEKPTHSSV